MKRELTLTDIAGYLDHPLLGQHPTGAICWIDVEFIVQHGIALAGYKPVLRPMSDLCEEITDQGYNEGKPFVPLIELTKAGVPKYDYYKFLDACGIVECNMQNSNDINHLVYYSHSPHACSYMEIDLLHRLHLDYRGLIDAGLAVSVHDLPTNPYEA